VERDNRDEGYGVWCEQVAQENAAGGGSNARTADSPSPLPHRRGFDSNAGSPDQRLENKTMKPTLPAVLGLIAGHFCGALAGPSETVTRTFYLTGVECGACVYLVQLSASERRGVLKAEVEQTADSYANVTFDPGLVSEHQIAQAIREAMPLHGAPYLARLKVRVGDSGKHAAAVDLLFQQWRGLVECEWLDRSKGELMVHFQPLDTRATQTAAAGWSATQFRAALKAGLPPDVAVTFVEERPPGF
jgi:hypothetical protein